MAVETLRKYLASVRLRPAEPSLESVKECLKNANANAVKRGDQEGAKAIWCLETTLRIQDLYLEAFSELKAHEFYKAWCDLERAQLALLSLQRHDMTGWAEFRLGFIQKHIERWQSIFPYKIFLSPEFITLEKRCSICGRVLSPRKPCGHVVGEIYDGEECFRRVTQQPIGVSLVDKPLQKYSVVFLIDPETGAPQDHYNYAIIEYAVSALQNPFDGWDVEHTKRLQPHSRFTHLGRNDPCPCGSKKIYKKCCGPREGVLCPDVEFRFEVAPPLSVPSYGFFVAG